ncbi:hypothetical protein RhiirB3_452107 [Rhizophagus irregularis]|nr:hypothetical protein RhiirB3_452107 [Rhizophagus irregularis]
MGLAQNPKLPSNTKEFTKDQSIALENTLQHIIHLIKFREMNSKEFSKKIITLQQAELISKWIDKSDELTTSYNFKLLYRGSHETLAGFDAFKEFHEKCDNKSRTVTIIKVTKFLENNNNILSHVVDEKNAVYISYYVGPSFGNCDLETGELCFVEEFEVFQIMLNLPISS